MLICIGLSLADEPKMARRIATQRFCATCAKNGFAENYDAQTGEPLRDEAYTWAASAFLELARACTS